ncbi:PREDICTED: E3 ubiquitin-protein ligase RNF43-like, partial [Acanthisitta chloris]|uniref:E3 ubiquitin-protein ligase RNF43-like n=1 Tax=Acanthisitta chloris TaxID=57068 RepID=UPI0004F0DD40
PNPSVCGQPLAPHRTCSLQPQPPCLGLKAALAQKQHRVPALRRGVGHGHQHNSSGSGESYLTEHSGYLADGPGSDSSSGPCHGSSSDSMLNCTDVSLQGIHGSCSTFRSSLSRRDTECPPGRGPGQRKSRYSGAKVGFHGARTQRRTEKSHPCQQPAGSSAVLQEAAPAGQPGCPQEGWEPPHIPSASPHRLDFSGDANRQSGAAGTAPASLPPRHSFQSRHHRRKRKCPLEPDPALLPKDSALPKACEAHLPHSHPTASHCSPEVQPLIPSAPLASSSGSRPLWKCLVPQSSSELRKQEVGVSGREGNRSVPADLSGSGTPRHSLSLHLHCPSQGGQ